MLGYSHRFPGFGNSVACQHSWRPDWKRMEPRLRGAHRLVGTDNETRSPNGSWATYKGFQLLVIARYARSPGEHLSRVACASISPKPSANLLPWILDLGVSRYSKPPIATASTYQLATRAVKGYSVVADDWTDELPASWERIQGFSVS